MADEQDSSSRSAPDELRNRHPSRQSETRAPDGTFVGRDGELNTLRGGLDDALCARGRLFLLVGEAGIGKTRLAQELTALAAPRGAQILWGRCWQDRGAPPYWPWVQIFRALLRTTDRERVVAGALNLARLAAIVPEILDLAGPQRRSVDAAPLGTLPSEERFPLFDTASQVLRRCAELQPLVLVLDDLHAADPPSLRLLQHIARELHASRLLLIATYRPIEVAGEPQRAEVLGEIGRYGQHLPMAGLSAPEVGKLMQTVLGAPPSAPLVAAVYERTAGNPLFVDEIARLLAAEGGGWGAAGMPRPEIRIPQGVREAVRARLRPLSPACQTLLTAAAVLGGEFDVARLRAAGELPAAQLLDLLQEATQAGIVTARPGKLGRFGFHHVLIRDTLYDDLSAAERVRWHRRVGTALEALFADHPEPHLAELAHHFVHAALDGDVQKAVSYATRAAERETVQLAYEDAARHYRDALEALALAAAPDRVRQCELLLALGDVQRAAGSSVVRDTFQQAADLARPLGARVPGPVLLARAALGFADHGLGLPHTSPDPSVAALLEEALDRLGDVAPALRAGLLGRLAIELSYAWNESSSEGLSAQAVEAARQAADEATLALVLSCRHVVLWRLDRITDRLNLATEIVELAQRVRRKELEMQGRTWRLVDLMCVGDARAFDAEVEAFARAASTLRQPRYLWVAANFRVLRAIWGGQWIQAEQLVEQAQATERTSDPTATAAAGVQIFLIRREQGRLAAEESTIRFFVARFPETPTPRCFLALLLSDLGRQAEARVEFERLASEGFAEVRRERRIGILPHLAEVCAGLGDTQRAIILYEMLLPYARLNMPHGAVACFGSGSLYLGLLAETLSRGEVAARHFEDAIEHNAHMEARPWEAHSRYAYARAILRRGAEDGMGQSQVRRQARELLSTALESAHALGMVRLAEQSDALLQQVRAADEEEAGFLAYGTGGVRHGAVLPNGRSGKILSFRNKRQPGAEPPTNGGAPAEAAEVRRALASLPALPAQAGIFQRDGEYWSVGDTATLMRLKHSKGLRYVAYLLRHPGREFHATDLAALDYPPEADHPASPVPGCLPGAGERGEPVLDVRAKSAYKRRLRDLREELDEAERFNDLGRRGKLQTEIDFLTEELAHAVGLGGRDRRTGSYAERSRVNVTRAIKAVLKRIEAQNLHLGSYLGSTIKTGTFCSYTPDPRLPISWTL